MKADHTLFTLPKFSEKDFRDVVSHFLKNGSYVASDVKKILKQKIFITVF
jgi:hypothetical protein